MAAARSVEGLEKRRAEEREVLVEDAAREVGRAVLVEASAASAGAM